MKAVVLKAFGDIDRLEIKDIPVPTIGEDEVLIRPKPSASILWIIKSAKV